MSSGDELRLSVSETSMLARYADWHGSGRGRPVAALGTSPATATYFVADELLVDRDDTEVIDELVRDFGAEVVRERPLPEPPPLIRRHRRVSLDLDAMPGTVRLVFPQPPRLPEGTAGLAEAILTHTATRGEVMVTSEAAAGLAALAARYADRPAVGLNIVGTTTGMPLSTVTETSGPPLMPAGGPAFPADPTTWASVAGRTRMKQAWQLVDSVRQVRGDEFVMLGVLDGGFWLDANGVPFTAGSPPVSDFGAGVMQMNLMGSFSPAIGGYSPKFAGGPNPNKCTNGSVCPWHGNAVAGVAAAILNNKAGIAGAAGNTAHPYLFLTGISADQLMYCAKVCAAWGIDVLNMSVSLTVWEFTFGTGTWNKTFQFAADNGVIMVASAGNDAKDLPDEDNPRPATRTPGVVTVGSLQTNGEASGFSNHGRSVNLWAPGEDIPCPPDRDNPQGSLQSGTSMAAPIVAGVAAMMRYVNPALSAHDARQILVDTGWQGKDRVSRGVDAYAAVFKALQARLDDISEPNNTPETARALVSHNGRLRPAVNQYSAVSAVNDHDYWWFTVDRFSMVTVTVDWYELIGSLTVSIESYGSNDRSISELSERPGPGHSVVSGLMAPGKYRVLVRGTSGLTAYKLDVQVTAASPPRDAFEYNDSFGTAARMLFIRPDKPDLAPLGLYWEPGTYDATLHQIRALTPNGFKSILNEDYYLLSAAPAKIFSVPTVTIGDVDFPVTVTLFDAGRNPLKIFVETTGKSIPVEPGKVHYLKVTGTQPTRYRITVGMVSGKDKRPGPLREAVVPLIPDWWLDRQIYQLRDEVTHYAVEVAAGRGTGPEIAFGGSVHDVRAELISSTGEVLTQATVRNGRLVLDTADLADGLHFVRVVRLTSQPATLHRLPPAV